MLIGVNLLSANLLEKSIIKQVCNRYSNLSCSCSDVRLDVSDNEFGEFTLEDSFLGGFSIKGANEAIIKTAGCESHFDIDDNENLIVVNRSGYIFARKNIGGWRVINYQPFDIGKRCYKISLSSKDALLCRQDYENVKFFLTRILFHTFDKYGSIHSKVIYRGSFGDKGYDDRVKRWFFQDLDGDGKRDIKLILNGLKEVIFLRRGDNFIKSNQKEQKTLKDEESRYEEDSIDTKQINSTSTAKIGRFSLTIPSGFSKQNGRVYKYYKSRAILQIIFQKNVPNLKRYYISEIKRLKSLGIDIKYKRFKRNWFVLSYFNIYGDIVYQKIVQRGRENFGYKLIYSRDLKREFDPIIKYLNRNIHYKSTPKPVSRDRVNDDYLRKAQMCESRFKECSVECMDFDNSRCLERCDIQRDRCYKKLRRR